MKYGNEWAWLFVVIGFWLEQRVYLGIGRQEESYFRPRYIPILVKRIKTIYSQKYRSGKGWAGDVHLQWVTVKALRDNAGRGTLEYINAWQFLRGKGVKKGSWEKNGRRLKETIKKVIKHSKGRLSQKGISQISSKHTERDEKCPRFWQEDAGKLNETF